MSLFLQSHREQFAALDDSIRSQTERVRAFEKVQSLGLPSSRMENWKYTSLRAIDSHRFVALTSNDVELESIKLLINPIESPRLVFIDGEFFSALSDYSEFSEHIKVNSHFEPRQNNHPIDFFSALNTALHNSECELEFDAPNARALKINMVRIYRSNESAVSHFSALRVFLTAHTSVQLIERELTIGTGICFVSHLESGDLQSNAKLSHLRVSNSGEAKTSVQNSEFTLNENSLYERLEIEHGKGLSRTQIKIRLIGDGAKLRLNGILHATDKAHLDTQLEVQHIAKNTTSHLLWRGLADQRGRVVFHGGIRIRAGADGSSAHLSNKNLLLSINAEIDTQPVLEIDADEVQASHGATIGQLDENALFYLRSRGIDENQARQMMMQAFSREAIESLPNSTLKNSAISVLDHFRNIAATELN